MNQTFLVALTLAQAEESSAYMALQNASDLFDEGKATISTVLMLRDSWRTKLENLKKLEKFL